MDIKLGSRYQLSRLVGNAYSKLPLWGQEPKIPAPKDVVLVELDLTAKPVVVLLSFMEHEIKGAPVPSELWCKFLTVDGIIGWAYCGGVKFKEI
jgi:hypothetical protein